MTLPDTLQLNAWTGGDNTGAVDPDLKRYLLGLPFAGQSRRLPAAPVPQDRWQDPKVGWGVILPENRELTRAELATAMDAPAPIRELVARRGDAPVFRVGQGWQPGTLRRYAPDGSAMDIDIHAGRIGMAPGHIPRYLLIVGSPAQIPWDVQYDLHLTYFTGRLDLDDTGLGHYVDALLSDWQGSPVMKANTLSWTVDHGGGDITSLMRQTIGDPIHDRFATDPVPELVAGARVLRGPQATQAGLAAAIEERHPSLIVSTSHGDTAPLDDVDLMRRNLGLLIDADLRRLDPALLSGAAAPSGAIWFAQACCSAGSSARTAYDGVLKAGTAADRIVRAVAGCGETTAPLPRALLGASKPLRAFVGHVEPTFDWSLKNRKTGQYVTTSILECFHTGLFTGQPIGMALDRVRATGASFRNSRDIAEQRLLANRDESQLGDILAAKLIADDWRSIVLLGDPTCRVW